MSVANPNLSKVSMTRVDAAGKTDELKIRMNMKLAPKTITGISNTLNKGACDWGYQGFLAYGCQSLVVIFDPKTIQIVQALDKHRSTVVKVKWMRENYHHDITSPYTLRVASADASGRIIVWDVASAAIRAEFSDGSRPIADLEWLKWQDASHDLLAALHPPSTLVLWNADTGTKLWKKSYTETLQAFAFDPFEFSKLAFLGSDCILFVDDFNISKAPSSNGKKFYISSPSSQAAATPTGSNASSSFDKKGSKSITKRMTKVLIGSEPKQQKSPEEDSVMLNDCVQLAFHEACRNHLILMYPREILILDLDINQTVGIIPIERTGSPFVQLIPLWQRDALICLHENASISVRVRRHANKPSASPAEVDTRSSIGSMASLDDSPIHQSQDVTYDLRCQSDNMRVTKNNKVLNIAACPVTENKVVLIMSDSRVLLWEIKTVDYMNTSSNSTQQQLLSPLYTPGLSDVAFTFPSDPPPESPLPFTSTVPHPKQCLADQIGQAQQFVKEYQSGTAKHGVMLRFMLTGFLNGAAQPPLVVKMCPPLTTKNWNVYQPLLACGTNSGSVQVFNLTSGQLVREYNMHTAPVRGIEWVSLHGFLTYAFPNPGSSGTTKNELIMLDTLTGKTTHFRQNRDEESPIEMVRVSHLKQYFVVLFKEKPLELWDLRSGVLLREMPKNFPHVTALEWSPSHNLKSLKKRPTQPDISTSMSSSTSQIDISLTSSVSDNLARSDSTMSSSNISAREHFVFTDADGLLYHFIVEGNMIKDGSKIPPDGGMGSITCIAWKGDTMVLGDVDGNLNLWDLKARVSRAVPTHRGWIKKVKFGPGRGNNKLLVLYNDGVDIWDTKEVEVVTSIKSPRDLPKIHDADWAASDKPVLSCADGCLRVTDIKMKNSSSPMEEYLLTEPLFSPHLLPPKVGLTLKYTLQHQPWNSKYTLQLSNLPEECKDMQALVNDQLALLESDVLDYLPHCQFGTAQRCLLVARLFGDESEMNFWTLALHYLRAEKADPSSKVSTPMSHSDSGDLFIPRAESQDLVQLEDKSTLEWSFIKDKPLETCYDVLIDNKSFQQKELDRVSLHDSKRATYEHTRKSVETLILLGQADRAVQLLLETDAENDGYYVDSLRACLVASVRSSGASQSTIKLVATNLIANGKLSEGVQLLCLIDKAVDACRYLQTYGQWYQAAWLAKSSLSYTESCEVMRRWADHLASSQVNQKSKAVLVLLSLCRFTKVIEMLYQCRHFDRAALFLEACLEFGLITKTDTNRSLFEAVYLEYGRLMMNLGNKVASEFYCKQAGEKGEQLLKEVNILYEN
ncbi:unnamed protein product [Owenia fusiformis]|uniref:Uncharacterized protein n=1 Tax=Owenia fusiformis TaxID=6347 RepID=A0A8J1XH45_OWEFU|nr:unnamed protein product [Owenia fusiformis]